MRRRKRKGRRNKGRKDGRKEGRTENCLSMRLWVVCFFSGKGQESGSTASTEYQSHEVALTTTR